MYKLENIYIYKDNNILKLIQNLLIQFNLLSRNL